MKNTKDCPLCEDEITSDATLKEYCTMCGMGIIQDKSVAKKIGNKTKYFCNDICYAKYKRFIPRSD